MIQMHLTAAGIAAIADPAALTFTRFATGSGSASAENIANIKQYFDISRTQVFVAGQTYMLNGDAVEVDYNAIEITGMLNTALATSEYDWTELALLAKVGDSDEFCLAYGLDTEHAFHITPAETVTYVVPFTINFNTVDPSTVTVRNEGGVPWLDFLDHCTASVTNGVHGIQVSDNILSVNGTDIALVSTDEMNYRTMNLIGVDMIVDALPSDAVGNLGNIAYLTSTHTCYQSSYTERISVGDYVHDIDGVWSKCSNTDTGAILIVENSSDTEDNELRLADAQSYFCRWQAVQPLINRMESVEDLSGRMLTYKADSIEYNTDWERRMTGAGTAEDPYLVYTPYDLNRICDNLSAYYRLEENLDLTDVTWTPIGSSDTPFTGVFDGNGKTIRGLHLTSSLKDTGLFGVIDAASLSNFTLKDSEITSTYSGGTLGGIVGLLVGAATLTDIANHATVRDMNNNTVGGIAGKCVYLSWSTMTRCSNHGFIRGLGTGTGGLCGGHAGGRLTCSCCYNTGRVEGANYAAGMLGNSDCLRPTNCYNSGFIISTNNQSYALAPAFQISLATSHCAALAECATNMQAGSGVLAIAADMWEDDSTIEVLNAELGTDMYVAVAGGYPTLDVEQAREEYLPSTINLAAVDGETNIIYDAGIDIHTLKSMPKKSTITALKSMINTKSSVRKTTATLDLDSWTENSQSVAVAGVTSNSVLTLIPTSLDVFTFGVSISDQWTDTVVFTCTDIPTADITVDVLAIN